jgi:hypothetical protein
MLRTSRAIAWLSSYFLQPSAFDIVSIAMSLKERSSIHLTPEGPPLLDPAWIETLHDRKEKGSSFVSIGIKKEVISTSPELCL